MKPETKRALKKWALMTLRSILWRVDEWLHRQEVKFREQLLEESTKNVGRIRSASAIGCPGESSRANVRMPRSFSLPTGEHERMALQATSRETFAQWEARKSGVAVITKKQARRRRATAGDFDLRFAR